MTEPSPNPPPVILTHDLSPETLAEARKLGQDSVLANCRKHGLTLFCTEIGVCFICEQEKLARGFSGRMLAADLGGDRYFAECSKHGKTAHHMRDQTCFACEAERAERKSGPRAEARAAGLSRYFDTCERCAEVTQFHVNTGKCLLCYTSGGQRRSGLKQNRRAAARAAGEYHYLDSCGTCAAETQFHVNTGKCLACFTAVGSPRKRGRSDLDWFCSAFPNVPRETLAAIIKAVQG